MSQSMLARRRRSGRMFIASQRRSTGALKRDSLGPYGDALPLRLAERRGRRADGQPNILELSVTELSFALKRSLEDGFSHVRVRGEIGKVSRPSSGHLYFDLKDEAACIAAVVWRPISTASASSRSRAWKSW